MKETLSPILSVLRDLGGKFSFMDDEGNQFILASKEVFEQEARKQAPEQQLELPQAERVADAIRKYVDSSIGDDVIDRVNRDIAMTFANQKEEHDDIDDLVSLVVDDGQDAMLYTRPRPAVPTIRFESDRGDLAPQLQD